MAPPPNDRPDTDKHGLDQEVGQGLDADGGEAVGVGVVLLDHGSGAVFTGLVDQSLANVEDNCGDHALTKVGLLPSRGIGCNSNSTRPRWRSMRSEEFDRKFDEGDDITGDLDLSAARRPAVEQRRVNVDFPSWMVESLDREARRLGVTRQSVIKVWIAERLEHGSSAA